MPETHCQMFTIIYFDVSMLLKEINPTIKLFAPTSLALTPKQPMIGQDLPVLTVHLHQKTPVATVIAHVCFSLEKFIFTRNTHQVELRWRFLGWRKPTGSDCNRQRYANVSDHRT